MDNFWVVENSRLDLKTQNILNEYLIAMKLASKSELTIKSYRGLLEKALVDFSKPIEVLTSDDLSNYIHNEFQNFKNSTINSNISILSSFFNFCKAEEYTDEILVKNRWKPKVHKSLPNYLDNVEISKIKLQAEKSSLRNRTILEFLLCTGCRVAELQSVNVEDIDFENRSTQIVGKGKKIRYIHFTQNCSILLEKYIQTHPKDVNALFLGRNNKRITIRTLQRVISSLGVKANLSMKISPHCMRHTFATILLSKGASLHFIGQELGHSNDSTTRIYARLPQEQTISLYRRYMG